MSFLPQSGMLSLPPSSSSFPSFSFLPPFHHIMFFHHVFLYVPILPRTTSVSPPTNLVNQCSSWKIQLLSPFLFEVLLRQPPLTTSCRTRCPFLCMPQHFVNPSTLAHFSLYFGCVLAWKVLAGKGLVSFIAVSLAPGTACSH